MAINDDAVLIPGTGAIWTGVVGTATKPTLAQLQAYASAGTVPPGWTSLGHTSADDLPTPGQDGGETTTKRSWQSNPLRTTTDPATEYWDIKSLQIIDNDVLSLYYGGGDVTAENEFAAPETPAATERAVVILAVESSTRIVGWHYSRTSIIRGGAVEMSSDDFMTMPLRVTALKLTGQPLFTIIADGLGTPA